MKKRACRKQTVKSAALALWLAPAVAAMAFDIPLTATDHSGQARTAEPVTTGIPFARGQLADVSRLTARQDGKAIPAQFRAHVPWEDGSVRWALMDTQLNVPANGSTTLTLSNAGANPAPTRPVTVEETDERITLATGDLRLAIGKKSAAFIESLSIGGKERLTSAGRGLVIHTADGKEARAATPSSVTIEEPGPMRATVALKGAFADIHDGLLRYTVRVSVYAGKPQVKLHVWLENDGAYGYGQRDPPREWFEFKGMAVEIGLNLGGAILAECEGAQAKGRFRVEQNARPNYNWNAFRFTVTDGEKELASGARTDGIVALSGADGRLTTGIRHFWQNYEKAIELDNTKLTLWLWPIGGEWPRQAKRPNASRRGVFDQFKTPGLYRLPGSTHKGYEMVLDFSGRDAAAVSASLSEPLMALAEPAYYAATEATPGWMAPANFVTGTDADYDAKVQSWNAVARNAVRTEPDYKGSIYFAKRGGADNRGFWYGWMDYGDLAWAAGTSSLHYDWTWIMLLNYLRTGEPDFLRLGTAMARHRIDVDQRWSDRDAPAYRALTAYEKGYTDIHFGRGTGGRPTTTHNWISGVALWYMLTGEPKALECAWRNAQGVRERSVERRRRRGPAAGGQSRESGWSILALCSLYDVTGDRAFLDDALLMFTNHVLPQREQRGPLLEGGLQYFYGTQGYTELHRRTGDDRVLAFLREGCEADLAPVSGGDPAWRNFLANIFAYVGHVDGNDAYIARARQLFTEFIPKGNPPGYTASSRAWTKERAKVLRNGHILQHVLWRQAQGVRQP